MLCKEVFLTVFYRDSCLKRYLSWTKNDKEPSNSTIKNSKVFFKWIGLIFSFNVKNSSSAFWIKTGYSNRFYAGVSCFESFSPSRCATWSLWCCFLPENLLLPSLLYRLSPCFFLVTSISPFSGLRRCLEHSCYPAPQWSSWMDFLVGNCCCSSWQESQLVCPLDWREESLWCAACPVRSRRQIVALSRRFWECGQRYACLKSQYRLPLCPGCFRWVFG